VGRRKRTLKKRDRKHSNPFPFRNCQVTPTEVTQHPQKPSLLHQHGPYGVDGAGGAGLALGALHGTPLRALARRLLGNSILWKGQERNPPMRVTQHSGQRQGQRDQVQGSPGHQSFSWSSTH
jgi:hypothetical protein